MPWRNRDALLFAHHFLRISLKNPSSDVLDAGWSQVSLVAAGALLFAAQIQYHYYLF